MTLALMLALTRRVVEGDRLLRRREEWQWAPTFMLGRGLAGLMLGIVGFGRIGQAVGQLGRAHGMHVVHAGEFPLDDLVEMAEVLTLRTAQRRDPSPRGRTELRLMKPTAYLVNTSRGPIVDEGALADALAEGRIARALRSTFSSASRTSSRGCSPSTTSSSRRTLHRRRTRRGKRCACSA